MIASYVGSMAPGGRIVVACLLQSADEMRRVQRLAQRTRLLQYALPAFAGAAKVQWQHDACWQPLRELVERLLVVYDWDEALVALDLAVKPLFDDVFGTRLGALSRSNGDDTTQRVLGSLGEDCAWHRAWSTALFGMLGEHPGNAERIDEWTAHWRRRAELALSPLMDLLAEEGPSR
jgi:toluene monooxygenase system protein E